MIKIHERMVMYGEKIFGKSPSSSIGVANDLKPEQVSNSS